MSKSLNDSFEPVYESERAFGEPGVKPSRAGVRVDVQTGDTRRSRAPIYLRVDGESRPAFRCASWQAREIAAALIAAADLTDGHAI